MSEQLNGSISCNPVNKLRTLGLLRTLARSMTKELWTYAYLRVGGLYKVQLARKCEAYVTFTPKGWPSSLAADFGRSTLRSRPHITGYLSKALHYYLTASSMVDVQGVFHGRAS